MLLKAIQRLDGAPEVEDAFSGRSFPARLYDALLGIDGAGTLLKIGVLQEIEIGKYRSRFAGKVAAGRLLFTDLLRKRFKREPLYVDPLWEAPAFAHLLLNEPVENGVDIGTGCGALALAMAHHCRTVYASDVNPRALELARLNALVNHVDNIVFLESDLFQAFDAGIKFDHVVFNAPVGDEFAPRHMLQAGEGILRRFFEDISSRLRPGAVVQANICAKDFEGDAFLDRMNSWLGPQAATFSGVFIELFRRQGGIRFLLHRLSGIPRIGRRALRCTTMRRGWLTLRRRSGGRCWILPTNYHLWVHDAPRNAPSTLVRTCLEAAEAEASPPPGAEVISLRKSTG